MPRSRMLLRQRLRDRPPSQFLWRACGFGLSQVVNRWMSTLNYRAALYDPSADPGAEFFCGPNIYLLWHEYIPLPFYLRPRCRLMMLVSQHQDAEVLSHAAQFAGLETVRGSTSRGGVAAIRQILDRSQGKNLAITPDGPRGPRRVLAQGCIYLSSRLGIPIVPIGFGYDRPWRHASSWDKFAIPRPFSKARAVCGPRIQVPENLEREGIEAYRLWVEKVLNQMTERAEGWAEGKFNIENSQPLFRKSARRNEASTSSGLISRAQGTFPRLSTTGLREAS